MRGMRRVASVIDGLLIAGRGGAKPRFLGPRGKAWSSFSLPKIKQKIRNAVQGAGAGRANRRVTMGDAAAGIRGTCGYYGAVFGDTLERIEAELGPAVRAELAGPQARGR